VIDESVPTVGFIAILTVAISDPASCRL